MEKNDDFFQEPYQNLMENNFKVFDRNVENTILKNALDNETNENYIGEPMGTRNYSLK